MKWINPKTGELERRPPGVIHSCIEDYNPLDPEVLAAQNKLLEKSQTRMPRSVRGWLEKSRRARYEGGLLKSSGVTWRDVLTPRRVLIADGAQVLNTVTETIMCPDFTFAADYMEHGDTFKYTLLFDVSTIVTTPQSQTYRLRWGGSGGTALATSGAFVGDVTAAATTVSQMIEWWVVCRSTGTAGSMFCMGRLTPNDFDDASAAAAVVNLNMLMAPVSAPAAVGSLDTTTAKALSPTITFSAATATVQLTNHIAILESLN